MRKPRDIDAELKALQDKQKQLRARRVAQFGELVTATGADMLDAEALAGVLLGPISDRASRLASADASARLSQPGRGSRCVRGRGLRLSRRLQ